MDNISVVAGMRCAFLILPRAANAKMISDSNQVVVRPKAEVTFVSLPADEFFRNHAKQNGEVLKTGMPPSRFDFLFVDHVNIGGMALFRVIIPVLSSVHPPPLPQCGSGGGWTERSTAPQQDIIVFIQQQQQHRNH